jgi:hypothetical protein
MKAPAIDMLAAVRALGGDLKIIAPGRLKVIAPAPLPNELMQKLRAAKSDLLTFLRTPINHPADAWNEEKEERAAIVEYDGSAPRDWPEGFARLDPNNAPADVPPRRWLRFIDDCGRFLDGGWARQAAAFGWGPRDLFGCDRAQPFARVERAGLLWLLNGRKLVAFTADTATIETPSGAHQTYRRGSIAYGEVTLAWELRPLEGGRHKPDETPNDAGRLSKACAYCRRGELLGNPLLDAAVDGDMFSAHRTCLDLEWRSWQREPTKASREFLRD